MNTIIFLFLLLLISVIKHSNSWITHEIAEWIVSEFKKDEIQRQSKAISGPDIRSSSPFLSGNGFRSSKHVHHVCDDHNKCSMYPDRVSNGSCVFVKTDFFDFFVKDVVPRIKGSYIIISHNGDMSAPDGQNDAPRLGYPSYVTSDLLSKEYKAGRLIAHHGQNIWWKDKASGVRPSYLHCLPIGLENRMYKIGSNLNVYIEALEKYIIMKSPLTIQEKSTKSLLLVAFYPKSRVPDRAKVLNIIDSGKGKWFNVTDLDHSQWLEGITTHKFVLAPFGHGLDTHRVYEILLMGGIPVMRKSTISSCYDDSDNSYYHATNSSIGSSSRGSLPIVWLDSWHDLTKERLDREWNRLSIMPDDHWDHKRLFLDHWLNRIGCATAITTSS